MLDNVRITDIPPSNWMFTLFPAANEHGANYELVQDLLLSLYHKLEKQKAIEDTLKVTVPSIITSALCFFAATIGVSIYTKIDMIGSICTLLARGAIISMLVVVIILPSLLLIFDGFILKTTKFKEGK